MVSNEPTSEEMNQFLAEAREIHLQQIATANLEGQKLMVDVAKHLTTLSSGSILLLTTFLRDVFITKNVQWGGLQIPIVILFTLSLVFALLVSLLVPLRIMYEPRESETGELRLKGLQRRELELTSTRHWILRFSVGCFLLGAIVLVAFAWKNFLVMSK